MNFESVLKQALADVKAAEVPDDLRASAFAEAIKHYATAQGGPVPASPSGGRTGGEVVSNGNGQPQRQAKGDVLGAIAAETGVPREDLEQLFYLDGDTPAFNVSARKLGTTKADRHRAIALLLTCARFYGLDETEVDVNVIREACTAMGTYDSANFSTYMGSVPGITFSGPRGKKVLRPRPEAKGKFKEKVAAILGTTEASAE